jgi:hypothetical protein
MADVPRFDPSKPFETEPARKASPVFDHTQPFETEGPESPAPAAAGTKEHPLDDIAHAASPAVIARASLPPDMDIQIKRYAETFKQSPKDFGVVGDHIIRKIPGTNQYARVEPSVRGATGPIDAAERAFNWVAGGAGQAIPAVTSGIGAVIGGVAGIETGPGALASAAAGGGAGGALGEIARQKLDAALAPKGEEAPMDWGNVAAQTGAGVAAPVIGVVGGKVVNRVAPVLKSAIADELPEGAVAAREALTQGTSPVASTAASFGLSPRVVDALKSHISGKEAELEQLRADAKALGVDLSLGQLTGSKAVQQAERQLIRQPETVQAMDDLRTTQNNEQIPGAVRKVMGDLAPDAPAGKQVGDFRDAADAVVKDAAKKQAAQATKAYAEALDDPAKQLDFNSDLQALFKRPMMQEAWERAQESAANRGTPLPKFVDFNSAGEPVFSKDVQPTWRSVDQIKRALDDIANNPSNQNRFGNPTGKGADAVNLKRELLGIVDPQNPAYATARAKFGESADAIDQILNGGVGFLNKMSGPDRQNMVNRVFSGDNLMPDDIAAMRRQFIYAGKSSEWNSGVRSYIADKLADAVAPLKTGGEAANVGGSLYKNLFEDRQAEVLKAAMGGGENPALISRWNQLGRVLKAASNQLPEGSPTATDTAAPGLAKRGVQALKYVTHPSSMGPDLVEGLSKLQDPENAKKLAETLLTPKGDKLLKALAPTTPGSPKANSILTTMLTEAGIVTAAEAVGVAK